MKNLRKLLLFILLLSALTCFIVSCGKAPKIEGYEWKMHSISHVEDGRIVHDAVSDDNVLRQDAEIIDMRLIAKNGKITVTDLTNSKTYEGTYTVSDNNPKGTDYHIVLNGKAGYAGVAMTTYADGTKVPTLPITIDGYSIYFYAE